MLECLENQATIDPRVLFEFKPIGLRQEGGENSINQAKAEIELVVMTSQNEEV